METCDNKTEKKIDPGFSYNLVIGVVGPYGAGASSIAHEMKDNLNNWPGIEVNIIVVADLIKKYYNYYYDDDLVVDNSESAERRKVLQNAGTKIRLKDRLATAKIIISEITAKGRISEEINNKESENIGTRVFIIDCLKNANEVKELRRIYGDEFYLFYVHSSRENRWRRMVDYKGWSSRKRVDFEERDIIDYDEKSKDQKVEDAGQEVAKLSTMADYYVVNNYNRQKLKNESNRFLNLLFGSGMNQPTFDERSMHIAFSASNRSFCLSRQVGAVIVDEHGIILGVGHNDVPKANGGLYTQEDGQDDKRCYLVGDRRCISDTNKQERKVILENILSKELELNEEQKKKLKESKIVNDYAFKELTEFCRAVHAEMNALISVGRSGRGPTQGGKMYVTTQPCHNCTKHIICAGITKVIYLDPYPKSLGIELHSDAIEMDPIDDRCLELKLILSPYGGVAPHRYHDFFVMKDERKDKDDGHYLKRAKVDQALKPRFADNLLVRTRWILDKSYPNLITANELIYLNEIGSMVDKKIKKVGETKKGEKNG